MDKIVGWTVKRVSERVAPYLPEEAKEVLVREYAVDWAAWIN
jgi:hypothetical protein